MEIRSAKGLQYPVSFWKACCFLMSDYGGSESKSYESLGFGFMRIHEVAANQSQPDPFLFLTPPAC